MARTELDESETLDGYDITDQAPEPDDDQEPLRAHRENPRAAVRALHEVREHEQSGRGHPLARGR